MFFVRIAFLFVLITNLSTAQSDLYSKIVYDGENTLTLVDGVANHYLVMAKEEEKANISFKIEDRVLYIKEDKPLEHGANIMVVSPKIDSVALTRGGRLATNDPINGSIAILNEGDGEVFAQVMAGSKGKVSLYNHGTGDMIVYGNCNDLYIHANNTGEVDARVLNANNVVVDLWGAGDVTVQPHNVLYTDIRGAGDVYFVSKPVDTTTKRGASAGELIRLY